MPKTTMRAALFQGKGEVTLENIPIPTPGRDEALIRVEYAGICGTDLHIFRGLHPRAKPPLALSHEFAGEVMEAPQGSDFQPGDRVVVNPLLTCGECYACLTGFEHLCKNINLIGIDVHGGTAEYTTAAVDKLYRLPPEIPLDRASAVEPMAVAYHGVSLMNVKVGDRAAVLGGGPIGILSAQALRLAGATEIMVSEINPFRRYLAEGLGFLTMDPSQIDAVEAVLSWTDGVGADLVLDAAAVPETASQIVPMARTRGEIMQLGMHWDKNTRVDLGGITFWEIVLKGSHVYTRTDFQRSIELIAQERVNMDAILTHRLPLEQTQQGIELAMKGSDSMKVLIHCQEDRSSG